MKNFALSSFLTTFLTAAAIIIGTFLVGLCTSQENSCECIPCGSSTPYPYGAGTCSVSSDKCGPTRGTPSSGCYTLHSFPCQCPRDPNALQEVKGECHCYPCGSMTKWQFSTGRCVSPIAGICDASTGLDNGGCYSSDAQRACQCSDYSNTGTNGGGGTNEKKEEDKEYLTILTICIAVVFFLFVVTVVTIASCVAYHRFRRLHASLDGMNQVPGPYGPYPSNTYYSTSNTYYTSAPQPGTAVQLPVLAQSGPSPVGANGGTNVQQPVGAPVVNELPNAGTAVLGVVVVPEEDHCVQPSDV